MAGRPRGDMTPKTVLAKKLQRFLGKKKFIEIAEFFGVRHQSIRPLLVGDSVPSGTILARLHTTTNVDLNWLLNDADTREGPIFCDKQEDS